MLGITSLEDTKFWMKLETQRISRDVIKRHGKDAIREVQVQLPLKVVFSKTLPCIAQAWLGDNKVVYNLNWVKANKDNRAFLIDVIIHECVHLVCTDHTSRFRKICAEYGSKNCGKAVLLEDEVPYQFVRVPY